MVLPPSPARPGVILVAHGSARSGATAEPVLGLAGALRERGFPEVRTAFWKEETFLHQALDATLSVDVVVLPVFLAEGYFSRTVVPRELGLRYGPNRVGGRSIHLLPPLAAAGFGLADLVTARALEATPPDASLPDALLVVLGHGTPRDPGSASSVLDVCARLEAERRFGRVAPSFIDQEPRLEDTLAQASERLVLIVPFLVAAGFHGGDTVPRDLERDRAASSARGQRVVYAEPIGTHPRLVDLVASLVVADLPGAALHARGSLSAILEGQVATRLAECGTLRLIEARVRPLKHGFEIRHDADADVDAAQLEALPDADALERRARRTADGAHRPLRTEASLARGWRLEASTIGELVEGLIALYGPALAHGQMGESGLVAAASFRETAARQRGMYVRLADVETARVELAIRRCCEGRPCLRSRMWTTAGVQALNPTSEQPRDLLVVPCPAPCPVLLGTVLDLLGEDEPDPTDL